MADGRISDDGASDFSAGISLRSPTAYALHTRIPFLENSIFETCLHHRTCKLPLADL